MESARHPNLVLVSTEGTEARDLKSLQGVLRKQIEERPDLLEEREKEVIRRRYGLSGEPPQKFSAVATAIGISETSARKLEIQALQKLRSPGKVIHLQDYKRSR